MPEPLVPPTGSVGVVDAHTAHRYGYEHQWQGAGAVLSKDAVYIGLVCSCGAAQLVRIALTDAVRMA
jgi:hypothetical protein